VEDILYVNLNDLKSSWQKTKNQHFWRAKLYPPPGSTTIQVLLMIKKSAHLLLIYEITDQSSV